ncbi:T9SS type A sorting domain-containing protein [Neptunitalea lumnitzerae]|uniref:Secretion system C-terminal sorting domain-containing protein n=1 Tax=Neptunitalea lumnitzerae TaxID=2965509 RepID=A0ABQ5MHJ9_9FLAO|nr:T9SS type A sorting domain-containing protein [Neptunitalea sp. Y10]GLB48873.1 hypothetical protein Y10_12410 [Neptunitalea sp. Y10]
MKRILQFVLVLVAGLSANAQQVQGSVSMGAGYANMAYYKLATSTEVNAVASSWDIAFLRTSSFSFGARINDQKGISVFEASINPADWSTIDLNNIANWPQLYNSETAWETGAFDNASYNADNGYPLGYGWGEYNMSTHHITGKVIFVLEYTDGTYRKFMIEDFYGGYAIKYATWDGTTWGADQTYTVSNSTNPNNIFNYFDLATGAEVVVEPASTDWDLLFTQYNTDYFGDGTMMYPVTGVLHHPDLEVAKNDESVSSDTSNLTFETDINTIGYDWKTYSGGSYTVNTTMAYYIKYTDDTIYRLTFATFEGSATGVVTFNFEDVTNAMATETFGNDVSFGVYPNPSYDKKVTVVYDIPGGVSVDNTISVYTINGEKVFDKTINANEGFYNTTLDLSSLSGGVYLLKMQSGDFSGTKKLILN